MGIRDELQECADDLGEAIAVFYRSCEPGSPRWPSGVNPHEVRDTNGRPILADMLAARGQVLAALAHLG